MKTLYTKHNSRAKRLNAKMQAIEAKYPAFDFHSSELRRDLEKYWEIQKQYIYSAVNAKACKSDNPDFMCEDCNCWKRTRSEWMYHD